MATTSPLLSVTIYVLMVWRFFLPECNFFCTPGSLGYQRVVALLEAQNAQMLGLFLCLLPTP